MVAGCEDSDADPYDHQRVCVEDETLLRHDDIDCDNGHSGVAWYYIPYRSAAPAIGSKATGGSFTKPTGSIAGVSRNGFGGYKGSTGG